MGKKKKKKVSASSSFPPGLVMHDSSVFMKESEASFSGPVQLVCDSVATKNKKKLVSLAAGEAALLKSKAEMEGLAELGLEDGVYHVRDVLSDGGSDMNGVAPARNCWSVVTNAARPSAIVEPTPKSSYVAVTEGFGAAAGVKTVGPKKVCMNTVLGRKLSFTPPTSDRVAIKVSEGLPMEAVAVWGWSLLGQYVGCQPGRHLIVDMMKSWGVKAKYRVEEGWMFFVFESEEDQTKVLRGGPYFIHGKLMILKLIPDKFVFNRREIAIIPLWVRMFGLPKTWTLEILGRIASHIGKPLFIDTVTDCRKKSSYARALVELNFAEPITRGVSLDFDDGSSVECTFLVENEPLYCMVCCSFGHNDGRCSFKEKKSAVGVYSKKVSKASKGGAKQDDPVVVITTKESLEAAPVTKSHLVNTSMTKAKVVDAESCPPSGIVNVVTCPPKKVDGVKYFL